MDEQLLQEIKSAKDAVADAEDDITRLLRDVQTAVRAEKTTISEALQKAFDKLRAARGQLVRLEELALAKLR
jgi:predicted  nucleic acid-binding Zn-ribbon protein